MECTGCGSKWTDAELAEAKAKDPRLISCCPERKMVEVVDADRAKLNAEIAKALNWHVWQDPRDEMNGRWFMERQSKTPGHTEVQLVPDYIGILQSRFSSTVEHRAVDAEMDVRSVRSGPIQQTAMTAETSGKLHRKP
jgi:hypothetical protein